MTGNTSDGELRAIACIDAKHLVAVGYDDSACEIFRTSNGGKTWIRFVTPARGRSTGPDGLRLYLTDVVFADATHGWAVGDGTVISTTDGGVTWTKQSVGTDQGLGALSFVSPRMVGGRPGRQHPHDDDRRQCPVGRAEENTERRGRDPRA